MSQPPEHLQDADEVLGSVELQGETFWLSRDCGMVYVCHDASSIVGMGESRKEAVQDARYSAYILYSEVSSDEKPMTAGLKEILPFAQSFAESPYDEDGTCRCSACQRKREDA